MTTRRPIRLLKLTVVAIGWLIGGTVGVGAAIYAFAIGPQAQVFLPPFTVRDSAPQEAAAVNP